jgi:dihydrodipicolinate synthase/N-acetylneuraminate lyase
MSGEPSTVIGPVAAAVTPRNRHEEIDFGAGFELIDFLCGAGVRGIALFTAAGEYASLAGEERSRFLCLAKRRSRAPLYAGIGAATLEGALGLAREARDVGAAALLLPPPHGFAYAQDDIHEFYLQFAAHSPGGPPVYLIDSPGLCPAVDAATAAQLISSGGFAGMADFVSNTACAVPEMLVARQDAALAGRAEETARIDAMLREFEEWAGEFPAPVAIKTALALRGVKTGPQPLPLGPRNQRRLEEFRAWFTAWLPAAKKLYAHA